MAVTLICFYCSFINFCKLMHRMLFTFIYFHEARGRQKRLEKTLIVSVGTVPLMAVKLHFNCCPLDVWRWTIIVVWALHMVNCPLGGNWTNHERCWNNFLLHFGSSQSELPLDIHAVMKCMQSGQDISSCNFGLIPWI